MIVAGQLTEEAPGAIHIGDEELPWVSDQNGGEVKLLSAKIKEGLWVVRVRFAAGTRVQTHRHTGPVYAYTSTGSWYYAESEYVNRAGSFLYEPAGSVHTLLVPETNLNLDEGGDVSSVTDATSILAWYRAAANDLGWDNPPVLTD